MIEVSALSAKLLGARVFYLVIMSMSRPANIALKGFPFLVDRELQVEGRPERP